MRKITFQMMVSLDGFFEGPKGELDWHKVDGEFNDHAIGFLSTLDTLLFGRKTYELMAGYWPTSAAVEDDPIVAGHMNRLSKVVFSRTLKSADWANTRVAQDAVAEVTKLKQQPGKDMAIFGSSDVALGLMPHGLIDECSIFVNPSAIGSGKRLFEGLNGRLNFKFIRAKTFRSGLVALTYEPMR